MKIISRLKKILVYILLVIHIMIFYGCQKNPEKLILLIKQEVLTPPAEHGLTVLKQTLMENDYRIREIQNIEDLKNGTTLIIGMEQREDIVLNAMKKNGMTFPETPESLSIKKINNQLYIYGADGTGLMYALLDIAKKVRINPSNLHVKDIIVDITEKPDVKDRSISTYTMQRAWFEKRLFDENYWNKYFDFLAENRFNSFVIIFGYENGGFMAPLYPYFFNTDGFPEVIMGGLTEEEQRKNRTAFNTLIDIAHQRGIRVIAGIWDHIYRGGVQSGGLIDKQNVMNEIQEHMVWGLNEDNLASYTKKSIQQFLEIFPDIDGIQFRMHNESGLKNEEMEGFWHEVFEIIALNQPDMQIDIRAKELPDVIIDDAIKQGLNVRVATKYWMEQMGMPFHPTHINRQNQFDRRHGYADLLTYPQKYKVHWRLWNAGTSRILLWGNPDYVRRFIESTHLYGGNSFEINEPLATKMETQPQDFEPFDLLNPDYQYYDYEFERYWYFFGLFGRLAYNPNTPYDHWEEAFVQRFGQEAGLALREGLHLASDVLPRIVAASYHYHYFPTTRGWAEKMHMGDLTFFSTAEGSDIQQFTSFEEEARNVLRGNQDPRRSPFETSKWFQNASNRILERIDRAEKSQVKIKDKEFISTITDLKILAYLSEYYAHRMQAAVHFNAYKLTNDLWKLDESMKYEQQAIQSWEKIVISAGNVYTQNLMMGICRLNMCGHWKDDLDQLKGEYNLLDSMRQDFITNLQKMDISIHHFPVRSLNTGKSLTITATVSGKTDDMIVQCFLRKKDGSFLIYDMNNFKPFLYSVEIPEAELDTDIVYFIKASDGKGNNVSWPENRQMDPIKVIVSDDESSPTANIDYILNANPGEPLKITASFQDPSGIKWVRLRYRHVTQFEDYQSIDMMYNDATGKYEAEIPGEFIINKWNIMYFIECMDTVGNGRLYPDLEVEMPYVIVKLNRDI